MKAVICAAGEGTRLGYKKPKCLVEVAGKKILDWQLEALQNFEVILVVGFRAEEVAHYVQNKNVKLIFNSEYRTTTTAHSAALAGIKEKCLFLDGDLLFLPDEVKKWPFENEWLGITTCKSQFPVRIDVDQNYDVNSFQTSNSPWEWACVCYTEGNNFTLHDSRFMYQILEEKNIRRTTQIDLFEVDSPQDFYGAEKWMNEKLKNFGIKE